MNLDLLRAFLTASELGSLSKAAERLRVSQSTLTRQMQTLEREVGGQLFDRGHAGVALTHAGQRLLEGMKPVLAQADAVLAEVGEIARGKTSTLRIGYLMSMAAEHLNPALRRFRQAQPKVRVTLTDLSPGEQLAALRAGKIDLAMIGETDPSIAREFFVKSFGTLPMEVALADDHPLAARETLCLKDLRAERFVAVPDRDIPGYNRWLVQLCRKVGYRPRFADEAESLSHALGLVVTERVITLVPKASFRALPPGVVFRPLREDEARWKLLVAWQRGKVTEPVRGLIEALAAVASRRATTA